MEYAIVGIYLCAIAIFAFSTFSAKYIRQFKINLTLLSMVIGVFLYRLLASHNAESIPPELSVHGGFAEYMIFFWPAVFALVFWLIGWYGIRPKFEGDKKDSWGRHD